MSTVHDRVADEDIMESLICSDQLYDHQYRDNIRNIFLPNGRDSRLYAIATEACSSEATLYMHSDADPEDEKSAMQIFQPSSKASHDGVPSDLNDASFDVLLDEDGNKLRLLKDHQDLEDFLTTHQGPVVFHIRQDYSHGPLLLTEEVYEALRTRFGIFNRFKDILLYQGRRQDEIEVAPPRVQLNMLPQSVSRWSSTGFELAYCIRYIQPNGRKDAPCPWSLRQFVVYQRIDSATCSMLSIFVSLPAAAQRLSYQLSGEGDAVGVKGALELHQAVQKWAVAQWRPYLVYLSEILSDHTTKLLLVSHGQGEAAELADFGLRQRLKMLQDDILDTLLCLKSMRSTVEDTSSAVDTVLSRMQGDDISAKVAQGRKDVWRTDTLKELSLLLERADNLHAKLKSSIQLLSSFLDLESGYILQKLSLQAQEENIKMEGIARRSMEDAAAVKLLTIIMLLYLPATIVLNFYSTEFISKTTSQNGDVVTVVDHDWPIMLAISLPLTVATVGCWWLWTKLRSGKLRAFCANLMPRGNADSPC